MKRIKIKDDEMRRRLQKYAGSDVDVDTYPIFAAVALNTLPVRKKHPLYEGAVHPRSFLTQMLSRLEQESIPLQIMHNSSTLPIGRVFAGEVVDQSMHSELQVLFWIDPSQEDYINLVDNGTVDQVSVSVLAKKAVSNMSGFDFFGEDATFEHIWSGTDPDGNVMGKDGAHVILSELDSWFEMSLVGQGGIPGARILGSNDIRLAASGQTVPITTLTLSSKDLQEKSTMDLSALVDQLATAKADNTVKTEKLTAAEAENAALKARVAELEAAASNDSAEALAAANSKLEAANAQVAELSNALKDAAKHVFIVAGDLEPKLPEDTAQLASAFVEKVKTLSVIKPQKALDASSGSGDRKVIVPSTTAFKRR